VYDGKMGKRKEGKTTKKWRELMWERGCVTRSSRQPLVFSGFPFPPFPLFPPYTNIQVPIELVSSLVFFQFPRPQASVLGGVSTIRRHHDARGDAIRLGQELCHFIRGVHLVVTQTSCTQLSVLEGRLRVAQHFSAGETGDLGRFSVPEGRLKPYFEARFQLSLRDKLVLGRLRDPAMNRWAILKRPSGSKSSQFPRYPKSQNVGKDKPFSPRPFTPRNVLP